MWIGLLLLGLSLMGTSCYTVTEVDYQAEKVFVQGTVSSFASSSNSTLHVAGTKEGFLYLYTLSNRTYSVHNRINLESSINVLALSSSGMVGVGLQNGSLRVYSLPNLDLINTFDDTIYSILSIEFSSDSSKLYTGSADSTIRIYLSTPPHGYKPFQTIKNAFNGICSIKSVQNGTSIITGSYDRLVRVYTIKPNQTKYSLTQTLQQAGNYVCAIDVSSDSVAIGSSDFSVRIYRYSYKKKILFNKQTITNSTDGVLAVRFFGGGERLMTAGDDATVRVYAKRENSYELEESISGKMPYPIIYINYKEETGEAQVLGLDGIFRRYLKCPKLLCVDKCHLYSECPTCYHKEYFERKENSKYCNKIGVGEYTLSHSEFEYEMMWYQNWYILGGIVLGCVVMLVLYRNRILDSARRCLGQHQKQHSDLPTTSTVLTQPNPINLQHSDLAPNQNSLM